MTMTGVVQEVGAFDRLALRIEASARRTSATAAFTLVFLLSVVTPALLNNDAAILLLTPLVVALTRRLYPDRPGVTEAFAFAVFLAPGVAPFVVSNPMNMIVAEFAGVGFNAYARVMAPIALAGAVVTYAILRLHFRRSLAGAAAERRDVARVAPHPAGLVGVVSSLGSALVDNHPMALLDMMALGGHRGTRPLLAALVGGDIGPRLLPIGSLAGLLWIDLLRRAGIEITIGRFLRLGTLVLLPTLTISLAML